MTTILPPNGHGAGRPVRVVVIDDDVTMRLIISAMLSTDPGISVVAKAASASEGRKAILAHNPDVVTLDVTMPDVDGLTFLEDLMKHRPMPVVMLSGLTSEGSEETIRALELGAVDFFEKPGPGSSRTFTGLARVVIAASRAQVRPRSAARATARPVAPVSAYEDGGRLVAIGSSTGGVEALLQVLSAYPANCPPTLVVQHMPGGYTKSFAARLDRRIAPTVVEAVDGAPLEQGTVYIAPGGVAHLMVANANGLRCQLRAEAPVGNHRPSVDVLFQSVSAAAPRNAIGVILTGMGGDGAEGLLSMRKAGARTIGQDEATSTVYGMPRVAFELGAVETQLPLEEIGPAIIKAAASRRLR